MILGFLGKGGSGKSSVCSQMALFLNKHNKTVLAIDADHNMDLSYNLSDGAVPSLRFFSESLGDLQRAVGLSDGGSYSDAFLRDADHHFSLNPLSPELAAYSVFLDNGIRLMTAGPQTDNVLYGKACSHVLTTPLKILLPLLKLQDGEVVLVDEKAGADGVSTGIVTGIDVGLIICEPAIHSIKTARQIADLMDFYRTPYLFLGNKVSSDQDEEYIVSKLGREPVAILRDCVSVKRDPSVFAVEWADCLEKIFEKSTQENRHNRLGYVDKKRNQSLAAVISTKLR